MSRVEALLMVACEGPHEGGVGVGVGVGCLSVLCAAHVLADREEAEKEEERRKREEKKRKKKRKKI
jgi:hypothetical protein